MELAKAKAQEAAIEAETKARFSIEEAKLKAELKLLELSERGSSVASESALRRVRLIKGSTKGSAIGAVPHISFSVNRKSREFYDGGVTALNVRPEVSILFGSQNSKYQETKGPFPLRAWKRAFFICFIDFFCARFNFNRSLQSKINKRNKKCSFPRS